MSHEHVGPTILALNVQHLTRRQLLRLMGLGASAAALAACGGEGESVTGGAAATTPGAGGTPQASAGKRGGQFQSGAPYELPPAGHFNAYVPKFMFGLFWYELMEITPTFYRWKEDKYSPALAEKWGFAGGDTFELTLKKGLKWSDGSPLTTKDVVATWTLSRLFNNQMWRYVDRIDVKDEQTVAFHMQKPATVVERYVLRGRLRAAATYGTWADKAAAEYAAGKTNTSDELKKVRTDFEQFRPKEVVASGPYIVDVKSINEAQLTMVRNPTGWHADRVRFDKILLYNGDINALTLSREIDFATHAFAVATDKSIQAQGIRVLRTPIYTGPAIAINFANPKLKVFSDKRARQALAHAVKRDDNGQVALGQSAKGVQYMAGFGDLLVSRWMNQADIAKLNQYPYDQHKAAELLQAVGCRKGADGQWVDPDGRRMEYEVLVPAEFPDWSASAQDWADQMTRFGIKMAVRAVTSTQVPAERREGHFEFAYDGWGGGNPHPHFALVTTLLNKVQPLAGGPYTSFNLKQQTDVAGEVDFQELITAAAEGLDTTAQKASISKAALAYNELQPVIQLWERYGNGPALEGARATGWPKEGDPIYENDMYNDSFTTIMIADGTLGPV